ncbi:putative proteasome subunit alpha type-6 [Cucumispora dikerogammari]|nr:putative proteasome subunit alpha type-6 [Cucumispora dikerogammari]
MADNIYDNTITFHPTGEIKPYAYIKNTIDLGQSKFLLTTKNFGLIATPHVKNSNKRLFKLSDNIIHTFSGTTNDGTLIIHSLLQQLAEQSVFRGVIEYERMYDDISEECARRSMSYDRLISCVSSSIFRKLNDDGKWEFSIIECSPFGEVNEYILNATGHRSASVLSVMEKEDLQGMSLDEIIIQIKECFQAVCSIDKVDIMIIDGEGVREFTA